MQSIDISEWLGLMFKIFSMIFYKYNYVRDFTWYKVLGKVVNHRADVGDDTEGLQ